MSWVYASYISFDLFELEVKATRSLSELLFVGIFSYTYSYFKTRTAFKCVHSVENAAHAFIYFFSLSPPLFIFYGRGLGSHVKFKSHVSLKSELFVEFFEFVFCLCVVWLACLL